jgi:branched-chain amino acid transport system ATP-binding protein
MNILEIKDIHTYYAESYVLQGISFEIQNGQVVGIIGRNGMGKTTLIRTIVGFVHPRRGQIVYKGADITHMPSYKIVRMKVGLVPQGRRIFPSLSVLENLSVGVRGQQSGSWNEEKILSLFPVLGERGHHRGNQLSGGEQQMLAIARALMTNPDLLLMDEPGEGLAPLLVKRIGESILELKKSGLSILLVEQNLPFATSITDFLHVLSKGSLVHSSSPRDLWLNEEVKSQHLGI